MSEYRVGSLREGPRAELIGGRVSTREYPDPAHTAAVLALEDRLRALRLGDEGVLVVRSPPVRLGPTDLLRPDLALLVDAESAAGKYHARTRGRQAVVAAGVGGSFDPSAVLLAVEVSRGRVSLEERLPLYAVAGVRELWLLDLRRGWTEALRSPWQGLYRSRTLWYPGERVPIVSLAGVMVEPLLSP